MITEDFPYPDRGMAGWIRNGYSIEAIMDKETIPILDEMIPQFLSQVQAIMIKKEPKTPGDVTVFWRFLRGLDW